MESSKQNTALRSVPDLLVPNPKLRLREQLREVMRFKHYSVRTEETYWGWIRQFILFHGKRHPREMGDAEVHQFLTHLATRRDVAAATQNQALNALVFLYAQVLHRPLGQLAEFERPTRPPRLPVVPHAGGSSAPVGRHDAQIQFAGASALWHGLAGHGGSPVASQGCGFWRGADRGAGRQRSRKRLRLTR